MADKWPEIEKFLKNPIYPGQFEISTKVLTKHALGLPLGLKTFYVNGDAVECTLECDYSHINVSGTYHRLYIIGIRNQVNLTGSFHSVYLEGFHNQVNYCTDVKEGQIYVQGDSELSHEVGVTNGKITSEGGIMPSKLEFPKILQDKQRRRVQWKPVSELCEQKVENME